MLETDLTEYCLQGTQNGVIDIFADGLEDPRNVPALLNCASLFDGGCFLRDRFGLRQQLNPLVGKKLLPAPDLDVIRKEYDLLVTLDKSPNALDLFTYHPPARNTKIGIFVGNERHGVEKAVRRVSDDILQIPTRALGVDSMNVVVSAAIAAYHLSGVNRDGIERSGGSGRPDLLLVNPIDPAEIGTSLRTAWALGWDRVFLQDDYGVWFARDRATYALGRGAARRHRNPVRVLRVGQDSPPLFDSGLVVTADPATASLRTTLLPSGRRPVVIIPDENADVEHIDYTRFARTLSWYRIGALAEGRAHYRITTGIVMSEIARRLRRAGR